MTHICVSDRTSIGSDNGLSPGRRQAIIRTNAGILLIRPLGTNFSEFLVEILIFSFKKMHLKVSAKRRPFCLGLNELNYVNKKGPMWRYVQYIPWNIHTMLFCCGYIIRSWWTHVTHLPIFVRVALLALEQSYLSQCHWSNPEGYGSSWPVQHHNKARTVYIEEMYNFGSPAMKYMYDQTSNIKCTKFKNLNVSEFVLQLSLSNPLSTRC